MVGDSHNNTNSKGAWTEAYERLAGAELDRLIGKED